MDWVRNSSRANRWQVLRKELIIISDTSDDLYKLHFWASFLSFVDIIIIAVITHRYQVQVQVLWTELSRNRPIVLFLSRVIRLLLKQFSDVDATVCSSVYSTFCCNPFRVSEKKCSRRSNRYRCFRNLKLRNLRISLSLTSLYEQGVITPCSSRLVKLKEILKRNRRMTMNNLVNFNHRGVTLV